MKTERFRIGIDVGGTFTHAVAMDSSSLTLAGKAKVPTTHASERGVGEGVVQALQAVMNQCRIAPSQIAFIAHSTTQATNSLLEGDVDPIGIVSVGRGWKGFFAKHAGRIGRIPLAPGRYLDTHSLHLSLKKFDSELEAELNVFLLNLRSQGVRSIVVTAPFSVDDPKQEQAIAKHIRSKGFLVTATHEVSGLYGLRIRTRTTAINASILPKMLEVSEQTEAEIRKLGITAPLMIMRSDGGVMTVEEMRKKPILTLLSGPAAGIAAALRYLHVSDGIFLEVGGTSTDISVIRNGRALTRTATIGGNKTYLKTLDCRTLGVGGGSLPRVRSGKVVDVGPRSAHIAGVEYAAFRRGTLGEVKARTLQPQAGDSGDYLIFEGDDERLAITPSCAANVLGFVPQGDPAEKAMSFPGNWDVKVRECGLGSLGEISEQILDAASSKIALTVRQLLKEYRLDPAWVTLIGGGGGASAIVPHLAKTLGMRFETAQDSEVISAIGVALGMIREVVEVSCLQPTSEEVYRVRSEARQKVLAQGADPATIEVFIEVDQKKNVIRAEAQGSIEFGRKQAQEAITTPEELLRISQQAFGLRLAPELVERADSAHLSALLLRSEAKSFWRKSEKRFVSVMDGRGVVRLKLGDAAIVETTAGQAVPMLREHLESHTRYDDGGTTYPFIYTLVGDRIIDLSKLNTPEHFNGVLEMEIREVPEKEKAVLIFSQNGIEA